MLAREAEETALRLIEREQAEALRHKLPDFWLPSLTPTYTSNGPPSSLKDFKVQTMCRGGDPPHAIKYVSLPRICKLFFITSRIRSLKSFIPVQFSFPASSSAHSTDSTPRTNEVRKVEESKNPICPSCKTDLSNNKILFCTCTLLASRYGGSHITSSNAPLFPRCMQRLHRLPRTAS